MSGDAARQRPLYPSEVPLKKIAPFDGRTFDGRTDRGTAVLPSVDPSKRPSTPRLRALSATDARVVRWIEAYVPGELPRDVRPALVERGDFAYGFVGARRFVLRYGPELVLAALGDMTYVEVDGFGKRRWWLARIVSPASYLHFTVKEFAAAT